MCNIDFESTLISDSCYISWLVSSDSGISWTGPYTVVDTIGPWFEDKQFTACDRTGGAHSGNLYVAWTRYYASGDPRKIMFSRSTTGAVTWDDTLVIAAPVDASSCGLGMVGAGQLAYPLVGADGSVYVFWSGVYYDSPMCSFGTELRFAKSIDGGASFSPPTPILRNFGNYQLVDGGIDVYCQAVGAADITGGIHDNNIYVAYANRDTSNTEFIDSDYNIEFIRSTNGGLTWTDPIYINDDYTGDSAYIDQFHPWLACDEDDGTLVSIWYDQRLDGTAHYKFWVYAAYSFDGGLTFTSNHQISDSMINPDYLGFPTPDIGNNNQRNSNPTSSRAGRIAEYIGVTTSGGKAHAVWTGTGGEGFMDLFGPGQNVYGASWDIPLTDPRLLTPAENDSLLICFDSITFTWATAWKPDSVEYEFQILTANNLLTSIDTATIINSITLDLSTLIPSELYYWRVRAIRINPFSPPDSSEYTLRVFYEQTGCVVPLAGDYDGSGSIDISDLTATVDWMFKNGIVTKDINTADVNASCAVDVADLTYRVNYMFKNGDKLVYGCVE